MKKGKLLALVFITLSTVFTVCIVVLNASKVNVILIKSDTESNGYYPQATITYSEDKKIIDLKFDALMEDGTSKVFQSKNGEYIMTEDGALIHEQLSDLERYIISTQELKSLNLNDEGRTDVISSASIKVNVYTQLVEQFFNQ